MSAETTTEMKTDPVTETVPNGTDVPKDAIEPQKKKRGRKPKAQAVNDSEIEKTDDGQIEQQKVEKKPKKQSTKKTGGDGEFKKKRGKNAFLYFADDNRARIQIEIQTKQIGAVAKKLSSEWKALAPDEKAKYEKMANEAKAANCAEVSVEA